MGETFMIARHMGVRGTAILKIDRQQAIQVLRNNRGVEFQLAVLGGKNLAAVKKVYGEYTPYYTVESLDELFEYVKSKPIHV